ncbi:putative oxido [Cyphellophora attinorum]|uniref:D-xylose reductase [NAD(P)H] n=1 Tax=Cyphellophora attinorum TaxID=1664694 RepID=A0A0N1HWI6_9EURO|nr:putative oxido [Phialophora attinorum]KPI44572.1 putative oxido [Phialophora attinorum]
MYASCLAALRNGYRHIDTAQIYQNEAETGAAIAQSGVPRAELFICSKLWEDMYGRESALQGVRQSCQKLGVDYIDLYLLHTPRPGRKLRHESWLGLQDAVRQGLVKAIGVSNWAPKHIEQLMAEDGVEFFPAVNQLEFHPWQQQRDIRAWCEEKGMVIVAYSPLTQGKRLGDPVVKEVAEKVGRTPAQVVLRWCLQSGVVVIPKSDKEARIKENSNVFGWSLDEEDMKRLDVLDEGMKGNQGEWDPQAWD